MSLLWRNRSPRAGAAAALALALAATGLGFLSGGPARAADPVAQVWVTTGDGARKLSSDGTLAFAGTPQGVDLRIDGNQRGQRYTGAGASVTGASARLIQQLPADRRAELMRSLFSTAGDGIGLSYLRQPLASTDFDASNDPYSYEDTRGRFTIERDKREIIPVVKQALGVNPAIRFMGTPWSPPAWMKTGNSLNGGSLRTENYGDFADYLVKAIKAYGQEGINLSDLTVQNEPENPTSYPSMAMTPAQQADFVRILDQRLAAAGLPTNILAFDHNWNNPGYPLEVFSRTSGINRVIGAAFHCYGGNPSAQQQVYSTGKRVFFTECSGTDSDNTANTFRDSLRWQAENLVVQNMRNGGETVVTWNLALDQNGGPHQGLCGTRCNGVVEIAGGNVNRGAEYYSLGHISKFVKVGATRIGSTSQGAGGIQNVAFQNPDGTRVAYVVNTGGTQRFSLTDNGRSLAYTLPAGAVATFVWNPSGGGEPAGPIDTGAWYRVANTSSGACLDATDWGTANGTLLQQWTCGDGANEKWQFRSTGDGYYQVVNQFNNKSWDVDGGSGATADGTKVHLWDYVGGTNQQWRAESVASGQYRFVARHSNKCLAVDGSSTADGAKLSQQTCSGSAAQTFRLTS
ncbi:putative glycosyl hydrolase [Streptomyces zinciresistens K42]|uniref:Putative glycosyl hydrolase n=1 Tax=Streptomyces zinciresistens K42 TaxID=700597 RepID=G2GDI3_9ACTN|nr:RICIN domain-containing protein [Streptomyces zinciresistens]EGX58450.1 putative glycosyl hydrolase [Streptomyces zinciresistens K42]